MNGVELRIQARRRFQIFYRVLFLPRVEKLSAWLIIGLGSEYSLDVCPQPSLP